MDIVHHAYAKLLSIARDQSQGPLTVGGRLAPKKKKKNLFFSVCVIGRGTWDGTAVPLLSTQLRLIRPPLLGSDPERVSKYGVF